MTSRRGAHQRSSREIWTARREAGCAVVRLRLGCAMRRVSESRSAVVVSAVSLHPSSTRSSLAPVTARLTSPTVSCQSRSTYFRDPLSFRPSTWSRWGHRGAPCYAYPGAVLMFPVIDANDSEVACPHGSRHACWRCPAGVACTEEPTTPYAATSKLLDLVARSQVTVMKNQGQIRSIRERRRAS